MLDEIQLSPPPAPPIITFPRFPDLPIELRLNIWAVACYQDPRNIVLCSEFRWETDTSFLFPILPPMLNPVRTPGVFLACQESRLEASNHYSFHSSGWLFCLTRSAWDASCWRCPGIWVNHSCDRLVPRGVNCIKYLMDFRIGLRSIAIDFADSFHFGMLSRCYTNTGGMSPFEALEEIILYDGSDFDPFRRAYRGPRVKLQFGDYLQSRHGFDSTLNASRLTVEATSEMEGDTEPSSPVADGRLPKFLVMQPVAEIVDE